jgi:flagellar biosynthetic protein FliR
LWLFDPQRLLLFVLVLSRLSGLVMIAPVFGSADVPLRVRALLTATLTLLVLPALWQAPLPAIHSGRELLLYVGNELLVGYVLGLGVWLLLVAMQVAGQLISQTSGISLAEVFDPQFDASFPLVSQWLTVLTLAVFVLLDGHLLLLEGLLQSFAALPVGRTIDPAQLVALLAGSDGQSGLVPAALELGVRVAAPATAALLLAALVLGLISRTLPQLNVFAVGFGVQTIVALAVLAASLGSMMWALQQQLQPSIVRVVEALGTATAGGSR